MPLTQALPPATKSRGWMSFTVPAGGVLHFGGVNAGTGNAAAAGNVPAAWISGGDSTGASLLANGIAQATDFKSYPRDKGSSVYHDIKHADIEIVSVAVAAAPAARVLQDGSVPTATLGHKKIVSDVLQVRNNAQELFNTKIYNNSAGVMVVEVTVWE